MLKSLRVIALVAVFVLTLPLMAQTATEEPQPLPPETYSAALEFIQQNPDKVGIACYTLDDPEGGVYHNADESFQLASTFKILIAAKYGIEVANGELDPEERVPVAELERFYLPNTDGGAHPAWLENTEVAEDETVSLEQVIQGMIGYSSNANTDYLLTRFGRDSLIEVYEAFEVEPIEHLTTTLGLYLTMFNPDAPYPDLDTLTPKSIAEDGAALAERYLMNAEWRERAIASFESAVPPRLDYQNLYVQRFGWFSTPQDFAQVMAKLYTGEALGEDASAVTRDVLDDSLEAFPFLSENFENFGTKGGSLPGVFTAAYYAVPQDGEPTVLAVFYRDLPFFTYTSWSNTFTQQNLELYTLLEGCEVLGEAVEAES